MTHSVEQAGVDSDIDFSSESLGKTTEQVDHASQMLEERKHADKSDIDQKTHVTRQRTVASFKEKVLQKVESPLRSQQSQAAAIKGDISTRSLMSRGGADATGYLHDKGSICNETCPNDLF